MREHRASRPHRSVTILVVTAIACAAIILAQTEAAPEFGDRAAASRPAPQFNMFAEAKCGGKITVTPVRAAADPVSSQGAIVSGPDAPLPFKLSPPVQGTGTSAPPRFDSATVKSSSVFKDYSVKVESTRIEIHKATLKQLILSAYPISVCQIVWPEWMGYDASYFANNHPSDGPFYEVSATFPAGTTVKERQFMLRQLLAGQFGLVVHTAVVALPVYSVYAKRPRMKKADQPDSVRGPRGLNMVAGTIPGLLREAANNMDLDRPIVDRTGLDGLYEFNFQLDRTIHNYPTDVFAQMARAGLEVEAETIAAEMLVIDDMAKTKSKIGENN